MNLLISPDGDVLGHTPTPDNAKRHEILLRQPVHIVSKLDHLRHLPAGLTGSMLEDWCATSIPDLWKKLRKSKGLPKWGKVSVKQVLRCLYTRDRTLALTEDELLEAIPGASWISIVTAISMLKNPKYADGPLMHIEHKGGKYRRENG